MTVLHALWIDDLEMARYANETYGINARYAVIHSNDTRTDLTQHVDWSWRVEGGMPSTIRYDQALSEPILTPAMLRLAWRHGETVWLMDLQQDRFLTNTQTYVTPGQLRPPTLFSETGMTDYAGHGAGNLGVEASAALQKFGDVECDIPL